ncbi:calmodulin binding protein [Salix suchowensis]|nr:calmodulin binding protein [Salix suchowensis]
MMPAKLGDEVDSGYSFSSESSCMSSKSALSSSSSSSCYQKEDISNEAGRELKRKVKKLRPFKLARLPSLKLITRQPKTQFDDVSVLSSDARSSQHSGRSPNYMRTTTSSNAKKENLQKSARTLARRSSFKPEKSLTRLSSMKFRRPLMRKSSGGTDQKKNMKNDVDASVDYLEAKNCSDGRNDHFQASPHLESTSISNNEDRKKSSNSKQNLASSGNNSMRIITRTSTLRPRSQIPDSSIQKNTCSSAIKDSKFPNHLELQPGGSESEGNSIVKVCPYSYCSLHGHHHSDVHQLKRFVSMRRRLLKTQRSMKSESRSSRRAKHSGISKKGTQTSQSAYCGDLAVLETAHDKMAVSSSFGRKAGPRAESKSARGGDDRDYRNVTRVTEIQTLPEEADEGRIASLNLNVFKGDSQLSTAKAKASTSVADERPNKPLNLNRFVEHIEIDNMVSSASIGKPSQEETAANEENNQDAVQDYWFLGHKNPGDKQKHMGLWNLIYQHMASGVAAEDGTRSHLNKAKEEEEEEEENTLPGTNKSGSFQDFSSADHSIDEDNHDEHSWKIQQYQRDAIKHPADDVSATSDTTSDKELAENNDGEDRQLNISTSYDSGRDSMVQEQEEMRLKADAFQKEKAESSVESKSNKKTPTSWSNLRKILILKRFVKAFEKVRNFSPRKPRYLHVEADPEAEKVHLRHQTMGERKNSEEWMLDHALQQVISTLAPAQKRKVALLVQAFETVTPPTEVGTAPRSNIEASSHTTPFKTRTGASDCKVSREGKETILGITLRKTSSLETRFKHNQDQASDFYKVDEHIRGSCSELKEASFKNGCIHLASSPSSSKSTAAELKNEFVAFNLGNGETNSSLKDNEPDFVRHCLVEDTDSKSCDNQLPKSADALRSVINGETLQEDAKEASAVSASELHDRDFGLNSQKSDINNKNNGTCDESDEPKSQTLNYDEGSIANIDVVSSSSVSVPLKESSEVAGQEDKLLQGSTQLDESEPCCTTDAAHEKHKHMKFWFLIYKHMVSEQGNGGNKLVEMNKLDNDDVGNQEIKLQQIEAIRLVEEAIDQIPLPEFQEDSPDESLDQEHTEMKAGEGEEPFISSSFESTNESFGETDSTKVEESTTLYQQKQQLNSDNIGAQEKANPAPPAGNKPNMAMQNWSNLKKVILLKRFVKALEKVKKSIHGSHNFCPWTLQVKLERFV